MLVSPSLRPLAPWLLAALLSCPMSAQGTAGDSVSHSLQPEISLEHALAEAFARSPALRLAQAEVDAARSRLLAARTLPYNPELEVEAGDRRGFQSSSTDFGLSLSQEFEIGGQRNKRSKAAESELEHSQARFLREHRVIAASVEIVFGESVAASELVELAATEASLAGELLGITQRRFNAGAATQIDLNLAQATTARAERRAEMAGASARVFASLLAEVIGLDPAAPPSPVGPLTLSADHLPPLEQLVSSAMERRADLEALQKTLEAAEARLTLARANRLPNVSVGGFYQEEEGTDRIIGASFRIALPFFNRRRGQIAEAEALVSRSIAETGIGDLAVRREIYSAHARYRAARASADKLEERVVGNLADSLGLLQRSFTSGKIGLSDLLVFRRELIEARREAIEAKTAAWVARIALDLALGKNSATATTAFSNNAIETLATATQELPR